MLWGSHRDRIPAVRCADSLYVRHKEGSEATWLDVTRPGTFLALAAAHFLAQFMSICVCRLLMIG